MTASACQTKTKIMFYATVSLWLLISSKSWPGHGVEGAPNSAHCVTSCEGRDDGDYASCHGCRFFVTCSRGVTFDRRLCPSNLIWDNNAKGCRKISLTCRVEQVSCLKSCQDLQDGDYHSCNGCNVFASCVERELYDNRLCPGKLQWDDVKKRCVRTSGTCAKLMSILAKEKEKKETTTEKGGIDSDLGEVDANRTPKPVACITSCVGRADGNYQSCLGCTVFASCKNDILVDNRPCPPGRVWNDVTKTCRRTSTTCVPHGDDAVPPGTCITSCSSVPEGLYQSCWSCHRFARCILGRIIETLRCPDAQVWDDHAKECRTLSTTCIELLPTATVEVARPTDAPGTCVLSCDGKPDGHYQSCQGCRFFATCNQGSLRDRRPCAVDQVWDDRRKQCAPSSSTCGGSHGNCVSSCQGVTNGRYQSCRGCHVFVTCQVGVLSDDVACPTGLVWDDDLKLCVRISSTCNYGKRKEPDRGSGHVSVDLDGVTEQTELVEEKEEENVMEQTTVGTDSVLNVTIVNNTMVTVIGTSCIGLCVGLPNGNYQSCFGCRTYISCSAGVARTLHCPGGQSWDDNTKQCSMTSSTCGPGFGGCVHECGPLLDGNYQSCKGCHVYVTCSNGENHDNRPCPNGLIWDDLRKRCVSHSTTCKPTGALAKPICVTSCLGLADGDYQSCKGCHFYVTCSNEEFMDSRPCPSGLLFDSSQRRCARSSRTCGPGHGTCVQSCDGLKDGDYGSCHGCTVYATCIAGVLIDRRPCHSGLMWDDIQKRCLQESDTCASNSDVDEGSDVTGSHGSHLEPNGTSFLGGNVGEKFEFEGHIGDGVCVSSCNDKLNGDYQSCTGCDVHVSCLGYKLFVRSCPDGLFWDDTIKHCMTTSPTCAPGRGGCVASCEGVADGEYQSCHGCRVYVSCLNGVTMDDRPCPGRAVWDDQRKRCEQTSITCPGSRHGVTPGVCVLSCERIPDGDYQSCRGCSGYVSCIEGVLHENLPCPVGLLWDDRKKRCRRKSRTCGPGKGDCVQSCEGLPDGDFQSCLGCHVYATCMEGILHDNRPCPHNLVWDNTHRRCMRTSPTCNHGNRQGVGAGALSWLGSRTGHTQIVASSCIRSCDGLADGDYQSCHDCRVFATCLDGVMNDDRPCPVHTLWDDNLKRCMRSSATCSSVIVLLDTGDRSGVSGAGVAWRSSGASRDRQLLATSSGTSIFSSSCTSSCEGLSDGSYQSCHDCRVYVTCLAEETHDDRPCPGRTLWDDLRKRCLRVSSTCSLHGSHRSVGQHATRRRHQTGSRAVSRSHAASCIRSCAGLGDGDYASCHDCRVYATCLGGHLHDDRSCPGRSVWDDLRKRCMPTSPTCGAGSQGGTPTHSLSAPVREIHRLPDQSRRFRGSVLGHCITSCGSLPNGDYQSCSGCSVYVSCISGVLFTDRKCPMRLIWDDRRKRCARTSSTCSSKIGVCAESCEGLQDGDYQSCRGCHVFVTCLNEIFTDNRPCPSGTKWDDNLKRCLWFSITCRG